MNKSLIASVFQAKVLFLDLFGKVIQIVSHLASGLPKSFYDGSKFPIIILDYHMLKQAP